MDRKNKIIFINPPLFYSNGMPHSLDASVPPLGLLYLASYINKKSDVWRASIIDAGVENLALDEILDYIKSENPKVIALTGMTPQLQGTVELAREIKKNFPLTKICLGGSHISGDPDFISRFSEIFDFAVTGEAEISLFGLLSKISKGENIERLNRGEPIKNLDDLPIPDRNLIKREKYAQHESIIISRGCPFNCYYCSRPAVSMLVRYRSPENIIEEIKQTYQYSKGIIHFQDDSITINRDKAAKIFQAFIDSKLKIKWQCNTRIDLINEDLISLMSRAGCEVINFGVESGNEEIRAKVINKPFTNEDLSRKLDLCSKYKIKAAGYFMLGHPQETEKTLEETKGLILKSKFYMVGISLPTPFPGSKLYEIAEKEGVINKNIIDKFALKKMGEGYAGNYPVYVNKGLDKEKVFALRREILRRFYLRPRFIFKKFSEDISSWRLIKKDIQDALGVVFKGSSSRQPYQEKKENKVVIVSPFFSPNTGGLETHLDQLAEYLRKENIDTAVLTYKPLAANIPYKKYEKKGSVEIKRAWWFGRNWFDKLAPIPFLEFIYIIPGLLFVTFIFSIKNRKKIQCFHAHGLAAGFVVRIVAIFIRRKKILSTHYIYNIKGKSLFRKVLVWVFKDFDMILPVGKESLEELAEAGLDRGKMRVFKQWVDNKEIFVYNKNKSEIRKKLNLPENKTIILFVGRLLEMKGIPHLIKAASLDPETIFVFAGAGQMENALVDAGKRFKNIIFAGRKFGRELADFYNAADMAALPSKEEGSSLVVVEALSCGKPVIITNKGCSKNMFPDNLGEKIKPSATNILKAADNIKKKLKQDVYLEQKCRNFALDNYSDNNAKIIVKNYGI